MEQANTDVVNISCLIEAANKLVIRKTKANACMNQRNNMSCDTEKGDLINQLC